MNFLLNKTVIIIIAICFSLAFYSAYQKKRADKQEALKVKAEANLIKASDAFNKTLITRDIKSKADAVSKYKYKEVVKRNVTLTKLLKQRKEIVHEKDCKYIPYFIDISVK